MPSVPQTAAERRAARIVRPAVQFMAAQHFTAELDMSVACVFRWLANMLCNRHLCMHLLTRTALCWAAAVSRKPLHACCLHAYHWKLCKFL